MEEDVREIAHSLLITTLSRMRGAELDETDEELYRLEASHAPVEEVSRVAMSLRLKGGFRPSPGEIRDLLTPFKEGGVRPYEEVLAEKKEREEDYRKKGPPSNAARDRARGLMDELLRRPMPQDTVEAALAPVPAHRRDPLDDCPWLSPKEKEEWVREAWRRLTYGVARGSGMDAPDADPKYCGKGRNPLHVRAIARRLAAESYWKNQGKEQPLIASAPLLALPAPEETDDDFIGE